MNLNISLKRHCGVGWEVHASGRQVMSASRLDGLILSLPTDLVCLQAHNVV